MAQFYINPDNYSEEEIIEIKDFCIIEAKVELLLDSLTSIQVLNESKFDLEDKIVHKLNILLSKI